MIFPRTLLQKNAKQLKCRLDYLEKVYQLAFLLDQIFSHPYLQTRLVLKGGTALNLFYFALPRLSVDIDLNYIGAIDRETMQKERTQIENALISVCSRAGFTLRRDHRGNSHAGGKWKLSYQSDLSSTGNIEIDINYILRLPLWPIQHRKLSIELEGISIRAIPILDIHELAAGKIVALFNRTAGRDLFDSRILLQQSTLNLDQLRIGFIVYMGMQRDWSHFSLENITHSSEELRRKLYPVLRENVYERDPNYGQKLIKQCKKLLQVVWPPN